MKLIDLLPLGMAAILLSGCSSSEDIEINEISEINVTATVTAFDTAASPDNEASQTEASGSETEETDESETIPEE